MQNINLDDFLTEGIIKEKDFREKVSLIDWKKYHDQKVCIRPINPYGFISSVRPGI